MSDTVLKSASVKVMLSYDYNHFEASMTLENESGIFLKEIDNARKECQRLCDKAIKQYQTAKQACHWTPEDKAKIKAWADYNWQSIYDYQDDFEIPFED